MKKYLKYLFGLFSFGLTLISMQSGFYFYKILFGLSTAILATGVFEILRLATLLYLSLNLETRKKAVAAVLYLMVAFICAFAASSSFHARIIESHQRDLLPYTTEMEGRAAIIQQKYAQIYAEKLTAIEEKIDVCRKKIIIETNSTYWPNRLAQVLEDRHAVIMERDSLISSANEGDIGQWVDRHAAITGVSFEALPLSRLGAAAITEAVHELWDIGELSVKKLMALAIVLAIEIGIILLAIFARFYALDTQKEKQPAPVQSYQYSNWSGELSGTLPARQALPFGEQTPQESNGQHVQSVADFIKKEKEISAGGDAASIAQDSAENDNSDDTEIAEESAGSNKELTKPENEDDENAYSGAEDDTNKMIMEKLQSEFRENDIEAFLKLNVPFFKKNGKLLPANKLNRRLQPIRKVLNREFSREELQNFFNPFEESRHNG